MPNTRTHLHRIEIGYHPSPVPEVAMNRLFAANMIKVENYGRPSRPCERAASGISPGTKKFFCKSVFHTKTTA